MTRKDIIQVISEELGLTQFQTSQIVHDLFDTIVNTLAEEIVGPAARVGNAAFHAVDNRVA